MIIRLLAEKLWMVIQGFTKKPWTVVQGFAEKVGWSSKLFTAATGGRSSVRLAMMLIRANRMVIRSFSDDACPR